MLGPRVKVHPSPRHPHRQADPWGLAVVKVAQQGDGEEELEASSELPIHPCSGESPDGKVHSTHGPANIVHQPSSEYLPGHHNGITQNTV